MKVDFLRFKAADGVELEGWLSDPGGELAVIHVHGMSGNGYENHFLDNLRELYVSLGITFLAFDNRGAGVISYFRQRKNTKLAGSCFEIFEESAADIQGVIDFLKKQGKKRFILQGHSLGASKVVNFVAKKKNDNVFAVILLAPTDMVRWAKKDPEHSAYLKKSEELLEDGKSEELVGAQCWDDKTPLSAQTYKSITEGNGPVDIYAERAGGSLLSHVSQPMLIVYGDEDIGLETDGSVNQWLARVKPIINEKTDIQIIHGAPHSFRKYEDQLTDIVDEFLRQFA